MKKRALNQTWTLCLRMWRNISKKWAKDKRWKIYNLKKLWIEENGFRADEINADCFFCNYGEGYEAGCQSCPGRLVDLDFDCNNKSYDFRLKPVAFYKELLRLNRMRKAKK